MKTEKFIDVTEYPSLQDAVDAAAVSSIKGGSVFIPPGVTVNISRPVILPRTDVTPINVVKIVGGDRYTSRIVGTREFPASRALIEWKEEEPKRTWEQKIANLTLELPDVNGVKAIHYQHLGERSESDYRRERLQIDLDNLLIIGSNSYHEVLIDLEASVFFSNFNYVIADTNPGSRPIYDTILLQTESQHTGKNGKVPLGDTPGISFSNLSNLHGPIRRGGVVQMFKGRLVATTFSNSFCNGGTHNPSFEFINCQASRLIGLGTEGREEKPIVKMTSCVFMQVDQLGLGTPNEETGNGLGNGLELHGCEDCTFDTRLSLPSKPVFNERGVKVIVIDKTSKRNKFKNWGFTATDKDIAKEIEIQAPSEHGNIIKGVDVRSGIEKIIT